MLVERTNEEIIIKIPASVDIEELQGLLDYARYKELTSTFKVDQKEADQIADQINSDWWNDNKTRLLK